MSVHSDRQERCRAATTQELLAIITVNLNVLRGGGRPWLRYREVNARLGLLSKAVDELVSRLADPPDRTEQLRMRAGARCALYTE